MLNQRTVSKGLATAVLALATLVAAPVSALDVGTYYLNNHPDGNAAAPYYGLRLDHLVGSGVYTFDFEHADSDVKLTWDGAELNIKGDVFGGRDGGSTYVSGTTGKWHVDFTYDTNIVVGSPTDDVHLKVINEHANYGTIEALEDIHTVASGTVFDLRDKSDGQRSFLISENYRNFTSGHSGAGWMEFKLQGDPDTAYTAAGATDWLFTIGNEVVGVPEPTSLAMLLSGVVLMGAARRRRA